MQWLQLQLTPVVNNPHSHSRLQVYAEEPSFRQGQADHHRWQHSPSPQERAGVLLHAVQGPHPPLRRQQRKCTIFLYQHDAGLVRPGCSSRANLCLARTKRSLRPTQRKSRLDFGGFTLAYSLPCRLSWAPLAVSSSVAPPWPSSMPVTPTS